jgi:ribosomal-protein-alanine N-acetyltransferase
MTAPHPLAAMRWWHLDEVDAIERDLFAPEAWPPALFWAELALPDSRYYLVALEPVAAPASGPAPEPTPDPGAAVIGYGGLCAYPREGYIQTIAVRCDRQGTGVGSALLGALLAEAVERDVDTVWLEVRADNPGAQRLYAGFGFTPAGLRRGYYQPSGVDAVVMVVRNVRHRLATTTQISVRR